MHRYISVALLLATSLVSTASAQRVDNREVHARATKFREAVLNFERVVKDVRGIERSDERIVDRFEEATKRMVLASKNPRHAARFRAEYSKMLELQKDAERAIFDQYTPHHGLIQAWNVVLYCQFIFEEELALHMEFPRHGNRVKKITSNASATSSR